MTDYSTTAGAGGYGEGVECDVSGGYAPEYYSSSWIAGGADFTVSCASPPTHCRATLLRSSCLRKRSVIRGARQ